MTPERWAEIKGALEQVLAADATVRVSTLDAVTHDDPELRREVEALLAYEDEAEKLDTCQFSGAALLFEPAARPERIGVYRVIRELGRGGMGVVYLGERADGQYEKQVAIKVITAMFADAEMIRRFQRERQILAQLDHPNIARLLDGGVAAESQPYLVMEFVEGRQLMEHCDARKMTVEARLNLFFEVCAAVAHAHNRLIVHRDLKPGNILVSESGPKLLDFGLARVLSAEADESIGRTAPLMTPAYASPEQIRGEMLTVATDVYSLGVILYELLAGRRPHRNTSTAVEAARAICDDEPVPLSRAAIDDEDAARRGSTPARLSRAFRGDLETILNKALNREAAARYSTVEAFAADLRRYLSGQPVLARPATFAYRAEKLLRRHAIAFAAGTVAMAMVLGFAIAAVWQARRAERRFNDVRSLAHVVVFDLHDAIAKLPGSTPARELLVREALVYLERLSKEAGDDPGLALELTAGYSKIGDVLGNRGQANLGKFSEATASYRKAYEIVRPLAARYPHDRKIVGEEIRVMVKLAEHEAARGDQTQGLELARSAARIADTQAAEHGNDVDSLSEIAVALYGVADILTAREQYEDALKVRLKVIELYERIRSMRGDTEVSLHSVALAHKKAGALYGMLKQYDACREHYELARGIDEKLLERSPDSPGAGVDLSFDWSDLGWVQGRLGHWDESLSAHRRALELRERAAKADPKDYRAASSVASSLQRVANCLQKLGRSQEALAPAEEAIRTAQSLLRDREADIPMRLNLINAYEYQGSAFESLRQFGRAANSFDEARKVLQYVVEHGGANEERRREVIDLEKHAAECRNRQN